jgi:hypothetical protein
MQMQVPPPILLPLWCDWKSCACAQWDPERLEARAEQIVDRRPAADAARRVEQIRQEADRLLLRHNCTHVHWTRVDGPAVCEECTTELPAYTLTCNQCAIRACRRCVQNRL